VLKVLIGLAIVTEAFVEGPKRLVRAIVGPDKSYFPEALSFFLSGAIAITFCILFKLDIFTVLGLPSTTLGEVVTGALVARGANALHQLIDAIAEIRA